MLMTNNSLFICLTPLQMLIAGKIISDNNLNYDLLCLSYNDNEKFDYYYNLLKLKSKNSFRYIIKSKGKVSRFLELIKFKNFIKNHLSNQYESIYLASVDNIFCHMILSQISADKILTFDDGTANIYSKSGFYTYKPHKIQDIISTLIGIKYNLTKVINKIELHYTIYPQFKNITTTTQEITLFLNEDIYFDKKISIYLGQPLADLNIPNPDAIFNFLKQINVLNYYPHPREITHINGFDYITSPLIFEDFIQTLNKNGYLINIYTVLSTAALNLANCKNVHVTVIANQYLLDNYNDLYELFQQSGCKIKYI